MIGKLPGEYSLWVTQAPAYLLSKDTGSFCPRLSFLEWLYNEECWKIEIKFLSGAKVRLVFCWV